MLTTGLSAAVYPSRMHIANISREVQDSSNFLYFATRSHPFSAFFPPRSTESGMFSVLRAQTPVESHHPITTKTTPASPHRLPCSKAEYFTTLPHHEDNVSNFTSSSRQSNRVFHSTSPHQGPPGNAHIFLTTALSDRSHILRPRCPE